MKKAPIFETLRLGPAANAKVKLFTESIENGRPGSPGFEIETFTYITLAGLGSFQLIASGPLSPTAARRAINIAAALAYVIRGSGLLAAVAAAEKSLTKAGLKTFY